MCLDWSSSKLVVCVYRRRLYPVQGAHSTVTINIPPPSEYHLYIPIHLTAHHLDYQPPAPTLPNHVILLLFGSST